MVKKVLVLNSEVSSLVYDEIASGYCERRDFKDLELLFLLELEGLGFHPDEVTYGILIGWSCREAKMRNALSCLSVMLSKSLVPHVYTYNALIRVLIAGYCKSRRFDEVKKLIHEMGNCGLVKHSLMENPISKDVDEYEKHITLDLEESMVPNFSSLLRKECNNGNLKNALILVEEMLCWGQELPLPESLNLVRQLCSSRSQTKSVTKLFETMPKSAHKLDPETLNLVVQAYCKKGLLSKVKIILDEILRNKFHVKNETYTAILMPLCKKGNMKDFNYYRGVACRKKWLPGLSPDDELCNILIQGHCQANDLRKVGELLGVAIRKGWVLTLTSYRNLVRLVCMKDLSSSLHYLTTMISKGLKPSNRSLRKVISSPCDAGDLQKALELSQEMRFRGWIHDSAIQTSIVESLLLCGKVQEAETFLDRMGEESLTPDTINYDYLIKFFCQHGRLDKAVHLMNTMLKKHNIPISTSYDFLIHGFCAQNKLDIALNFYSETLNWNLKPIIDTVEMLVHRFCHDGKTELAEQYLVDMTHAGQGKGFDEDLIKLISDAVSIPVIASSGAGAPQHFSEVFYKTNASAALAAGIFHREEVPIQSVKEHLLKEGIEVGI
ncbi:Pentatricopeptide repeat-containing protein, mitochondrial [Glycine max]|nr:Pentatricopeptide repeat-containing protein, mitochondrial [Glycine max]